MARTFASPGNTDWINCGNIAALDGLSAVSVAALVKFDSFYANAPSLVSKVTFNGTGSDFNGWAVQMWGASYNQVMLRISNGNVSVVSAPNTFSTGVWYRICCVYDGSLTGDTNRSKIWIDGSQATGTADVAGVPASIGACTAEVEIGNMHTGSSEIGIAGSLAEVGVWNRALTADEAVSVTSGYSPAFFQSGLVLYMPCTGQNSPEPNVVPGGASIVGAVTNATKSAHPDFMRYPGGVLVGNVLRPRPFAPGPTTKR